MDAVVNRDGFLKRCEVYGEVQASCRLSGMPEVSLTFTNSSVLNDVRFHPCVRPRTWESNQTLSFIPPDGAFKLMSYRVMGLKNTPIYVKPQLSSGGGICRVNVLVGTRYDTGKSVDSIIIRVPWPPVARSADLTANHGTVSYSHSTKVSTWTVGRIPKEKSPCLTGSVQLEAGLDRLVHFPTILVGFKIMGIAISGLQVGRAEVENAAYRTYKGFRSVTRAANYEIRTCLGHFTKPGT